MRQILVLSEADRVNSGLLDQLRQLFPECDIRVVLKSNACAADSGQDSHKARPAEAGNPGRFARS